MLFFCGDCVSSSMKILTCLFLVAICKCRLINELLHLNEFNVPFAVLKDDR